MSQEPDPAAAQSLASQTVRAKKATMPPLIEKPGEESADDSPKEGRRGAGKEESVVVFVHTISLAFARVKARRAWVRNGHA